MYLAYKAEKFRAIGRLRLEETAEEIGRELAEVRAPDGLSKIVVEYLREHAQATWEEAVAAYADQDEERGQDHLGTTCEPTT